MFKLFKKAESLGRAGESFAKQEYKRLGFKIEASNVFNRKGKQLGEIDFIARDKFTIIFVEVKTRANTESRFGRGAEAVNIYKQHKLLKAVKAYLLRNPFFQSLQPQIDVCLVTRANLDKSQFSVTIIANAVEDER